MCSLRSLWNRLGVCSLFGISRSEKRSWFHVDLPCFSHSCRPNTGVRNNDLGAYDFVAFKSVAEGDEITMDYETTECELMAPFLCRRGGEACRQQTRGLRFLRSREIAGRDGLISDYLRRWITQELRRAPLAYADQRFPGDRKNGLARISSVVTWEAAEHPVREIYYTMPIPLFFKGVSWAARS